MTAIWRGSVLPPDAGLDWVRRGGRPGDDLRDADEGAVPRCATAGPTCTARRCAGQGGASAARRAGAAGGRSRWSGGARADRGDAGEAPALNRGLPPLAEVVSARVPMVASEAGRLHIFRPEDGGDEHYAIEIGRPDRAKPVLARLHSACFTGDVLGSLKCDCGPQLHAALAQMGAEGAGRAAVPQSGRARDRPCQQDARLCAAGSGLRHGRGEPPAGVRG
jgi:GTP cyclohydrolase II